LPGGQLLLAPTPRAHSSPIKEKLTWFDLQRGFAPARRGVWWCCCWWGVGLRSWVEWWWPMWVAVV